MMRSAVRWFALVPALALVSCSGGGSSSGGTSSLSPTPSPTPAPVQKDNSVSAWLTTGDGQRRLEELDAYVVSLGAEVSADITIDASRRFQPFVGYGAAMTDASAHLFQTALTAQARADLVEELFARNSGIGLGVLRITIGASDFSQSHYTYADTPGQTTADIAQAQAELIPTLAEIRRVNPDLTIIASPWSAPAWMKTSGTLYGGRLSTTHYGDYAAYLVSYVEAMEAAGVPIDLLTLQNEPHHEAGDYPSMRVDPGERSAIIADHLGPLMASKVPNTGLLDWDHNWDEPESPLAVLGDARANPYITGVAWHCYGGDIGAQSLVHDRFPDKQTWFTECSAGEWSGSWSSAFAWSARNLLIGAPKNWARGVVMWNLTLDQYNGPHLGGCSNCRGLVTINSETGAVTRSPEYYSFAHGSRFVTPGSVRIGTSVAVGGVEAVAFADPDGAAVTLIVLNGSENDDDISVAIGDKTFRATMPTGSLATYVIELGSP